MMLNGRVDRAPVRADAPLRSLGTLRVVLGVAVLLAALLGARVAEATPQYPGAIDTELMVSCPDPLSRCLICHTTAAGGKTAFQLFALTLKDNGFYRPNDPTGLRNTIRLIDLADLDSDDDGMTDIDELRVCRNPSGEEFDSGPEYGCDGAHVARAPVLDGWGLAAAGLLGLALGARTVRRARALQRESSATG
jgi:hypothetical protein